MTTNLPRVTVTRTEDGTLVGFRVACTCGHQRDLPNRYEADQHATSHRRGCAGGEAA